MNLKKVSIFISLVLRHKPEVANIKLDSHGWAKVNELITGLKIKFPEINMSILEEIVATDSKHRYSFNNDKTMIRANQGHSVNVEVELKEVNPPEILFHGTSSNVLDSIYKNGIKPMSRLYVHLSKDHSTAIMVGKRHGNPVVLSIAAQDMYKDGYKFFLSENGVYLTSEVPTKYLI